MLKRLKTLSKITIKYTPRMMSNVIKLLFIKAYARKLKVLSLGFHWFLDAMMKPWTQGYQIGSR